MESQTYLTVNGCPGEERGEVLDMLEKLLKVSYPSFSGSLCEDGAPTYACSGRDGNMWLEAFSDCIDLNPTSGSEDSDMDISVLGDGPG